MTPVCTDDRDKLATAADRLMAGGHHVTLIPRDFSGERQREGHFKWAVNQGDPAIRVGRSPETEAHRLFEYESFT